MVRSISKVRWSGRGKYSPVEGEGPPASAAPHDARGDTDMFRDNNPSGRRAFDQASQYRHSVAGALIPLIVVTALNFGFVSHSAQAATAHSDGETKPCFIAHPFSPGPIVNGHHRQPTQAEIDERTWQLA